MPKARDDFTPQVGRGQRGDQRLPETAETHVGWLITRGDRHQDDEHLESGPGGGSRPRAPRVGGLSRSVAETFQRRPGR